MPDEPRDETSLTPPPADPTPGAPAPAAAPAEGGGGPDLPDGPEFLQESALGRTLLHAWAFARDNATWVLIIVVAAGALSYVLQLRRNGIEQSAAQARLALPEMQNAVDAVRQLAPSAAMMSEDQLSEELNEIDAAFTSNLAVAEGGANDDATRARSSRLVGDYNWYLATLPTPMPATRPSGEYVELLPSEDRLADAEAAYTKVIDDYAADAAQQVAARMGLAAIAEENGDFDAARDHYQVLLDDDRTPEPFAEVARRQIDVLALVTGTGSPLAEPAAPATQPAATVEESLSGLDSLLGTGRVTGDGAGSADGTITLSPADLEGITSPATQPATRPAE